jgi:hypothetical protein
VTSVQSCFSIFDFGDCTFSLDFGTPFIASDVGGISELIHEADHESVLFDGSADGLTKKIRHILRHGIYSSRPALSIEERISHVRRFYQQFQEEPIQQSKSSVNSAGIGGVYVCVIHDKSIADLIVTLKSLAAQRTKPSSIRVIVRTLNEWKELRNRLDMSPQEVIEQCALTLFITICAHLRIYFLNRCFFFFCINQKCSRSLKLPFPATACTQSAL